MAFLKKGTFKLIQLRAGIAGLLIDKRQAYSFERVQKVLRMLLDSTLDLMLLPNCEMLLSAGVIAESSKIFSGESNLLDNSANDLIHNFGKELVKYGDVEKLSDEDFGKLMGENISSLCDEVKRLLPGQESYDALPSSEGIQNMISEFGNLDLPDDTAESNRIKKPTKTIMALGITMGQLMTLVRVGVAGCRRNREKLFYGELVWAFVSKLVQNRHLISGWKEFCVGGLFTTCSSMLFLHQSPCKDHGRKIMKLIEGSLKVEAKNPSAQKLVKGEKKSTQKEQSETPPPAKKRNRRRRRRKKNKV